jgi:hypothetical protein
LVLSHFVPEVIPTSTTRSGRETCTRISGRNHCRSRSARDLTALVVSGVSQTLAIGHPGLDLRAPKRYGGSASARLMRSGGLALFLVK